MDNKTQEHISLLNVRLMRSIDALVNAYNEGYKYFKEEKPDEGDDSYYAAVLSGFAEGVIKSLQCGGNVNAATSAPIMVATALIKYLSEHPEFKSNLMF